MVKILHVICGPIVIAFVDALMKGTYFWTEGRTQPISVGSMKCNFISRKTSDDQSYPQKPEWLKRRKLA